MSSTFGAEEWSGIASSLVAPEVIHILLLRWSSRWTDAPAEHVIACKLTVGVRIRIQNVQLQWSWTKKSRKWLNVNNPRCNRGSVTRTDVKPWKGGIWLVFKKSTRVFKMITLKRFVLSIFNRSYIRHLQTCYTQRSVLPLRRYYLPGQRSEVSSVLLRSIFWKPGEFLATTVGPWKNIKFIACFIVR